MEMDLILTPGHGALRECCKKQGAGGEGENRIPRVAGKRKSFDSARHMHHHRGRGAVLLYAQMPQRAEPSERANERGGRSAPELQVGEFRETVLLPQAR